MKRSAWVWPGVLGAAALAGSASAQGVPGMVAAGHHANPPAYAVPDNGQYCPTPAPGMAPPPSGMLPPAPGGGMPSGEPAGGTAQGAGSESGAGAQQGTGDQDSAFAGLGGLQSGGFGGSLTTAGTGPGTAMMGGVGGTLLLTFNVTQTTSQSPLILPGLFTSARSEPAHPFDRVFLDYGYADKFRSVTPTGLASGFNLNTWDAGLEKTLFGGRGSVYVRMPYLLATDNTTGQRIDDIGDLSAGLKFVLLESCHGSVLTAGMTVSVPTGRDDVVSTTTTFNVPAQRVTATSGAFSTPVDILSTSLSTTTTTKVNPTILQPWLGGLLVFDRFYVQEFAGVVIPTDNRVATFVNNDLSVGYEVYRGQGGFLTSLTPTFDVQLLLPVTHRGTPKNVSQSGTITQATDFGPIGSPNGPAQLTPAQAQQLASQLPAGQAPSFGFPDQVFLTEGLQFGLGERALLSVGVVEPVSGPKAFSIGAVASFNLFF